MGRKAVRFVTQSGCQQAKLCRVHVIPDEVELMGDAETVVIETPKDVESQVGADDEDQRSLEVSPLEGCGPSIFFNG